MKEWQKHLDRAEEKLISAQILFENQMHNDTISEAYYSMYHSTKAILLLVDSNPKTHKGLVSEFGLQFVLSGSIEDHYGKKLALAEDEREKADYDVYYRATRDEAKNTLEDAEAFLNRIKKAIEIMNAKE
jgi:uncharacterized protein (UPF0332 family)